MSDPGAPGAGSRRLSAVRRRALQSNHALLQLARYGVVGGGATLLQAVLYALLADPIGVQPANAVAWAIGTALSTVGHRWLTFGLRRRDTRRDLAVGIVTSLVALGATAAVLELLGPQGGVVGAAVVFGVQTVIGCIRFVVLRYWFLGRDGGEDPDSPGRPDASTGTPADGAGVCR